MKAEGATFQGDSTHPKFKGQMVVLDIAFGVSQLGGHDKNATPTPQATEVSVRKYLGASSPELAQACALKTALTKVVVTIPDLSEMTFETCHIKSTHPSLNVEEDHPTEVVTLSWRKLKWTYGKDPKGTGEIDLDKHHK